MSSSTFHQQAAVSSPHSLAIHSQEENIIKHVGLDDDDEDLVTAHKFQEPPQHLLGPNIDLASALGNTQIAFDPAISSGSLGMHVGTAFDPLPSVGYADGLASRGGDAAAAFCANATPLTNASHYSSGLPNVNNGPAAETVGGEDVQGCNNLFIANISNDVDDELLSRTFEPFGEILSAKVMLDIHTGRSRGFGFVMFANESSGAAAMKVLHNSCLGERAQRMSVTKAQTSGQSAITETTKLYVRNVPLHRSEGALREFFSQYGVIKRFARKEDTAAKKDLSRQALLRQGSLPAGMVIFLEYSTVKEAQNAVRCIHGKKPWGGMQIPLMAKTAETTENRNVRRERQRQKVDEKKTSNGPPPQLQGNANANSIPSNASVMANYTPSASQMMLLSASVEAAAASGHMNHSAAGVMDASYGNMNAAMGGQAQFQQQQQQQYYNGYFQQQQQPSQQQLQGPPQILLPHQYQNYPHQQQGLQHSGGFAELPAYPSAQPHHDQGMQNNIVNNGMQFTNQNTNSVNGMHNGNGGGNAGGGFAAMAHLNAQGQLGLAALHPPSPNAPALNITPAHTYNSMGNGTNRGVMLNTSANASSPHTMGGGPPFGSFSPSYSGVHESAYGTGGGGALLGSMSHSQEGPQIGASLGHVGNTTGGMSSLPSPTHMNVSASPPMAAPLGAMAYTHNSNSAAVLFQRLSNTLNNTTTTTTTTSGSLSPLSQQQNLMHNVGGQANTNGLTNAAALMMGGNGNGGVVNIYPNRNSGVMDSNSNSLVGAPPHYTLTPMGNSAAGGGGGAFLPAGVLPVYGTHLNATQHQMMGGGPHTTMAMGQMNTSPFTLQPQGGGSGGGMSQFGSTNTAAHFGGNVSMGNGMVGGGQRNH